MKPQEVIETVIASGLRGRGGGGFPTGRKWQFAANQPEGEKFIICNADEGDPGAFMDRAVLEGDPHSVLEAMAIGGYAIGASTGVIYIRAEYPLAVKRLEIAIAQAKELGPARRKHLRQRLRFRHRDQIRRRRIRLRRGDRADPLDRGDARRTDCQAPLPRRAGTLEAAERGQQRRNLRERLRNHPQGSRLVPRDRHRGFPGHEGVRPGRQGHERRARRGSDGQHAASDHLRHRRRHQARAGVQSGPDRRSLRRLPSLRSTSTCRSTTKP